MPIYLPETTASTIEALTPRQIVAELDKYVVGQARAKRAVAIALRNRTRRQKLPTDLAEEIAPKNILMIGPTGVGKTEIARRLAKLAQSPFIKVEASKYTEVGYVGRDVESMVRDLTELAVDMIREERVAEVREKARQAAEERVLDLLLPPLPPAADYDEQATSIREQAQRTREKLREQLRDGRLDHKQVEIDVREKSFPSFEIIAGSSVEEVDINVKDMLPGLFQGRTRKRKLAVPEALQALAQEEEQKLVDMDTVARAAVDRVQQSGIIFIDEIDKVAGREGSHGPDVSREGVQRDILPIVEGTTVNTKYGMVKTDHILFIAAGAFHVSKPSDLIPELQGRFPIRVELEALGREDFVSHPDGTEERARQAVHGASLDRGARDSIYAWRDRPHRRLCRARQRSHREHRRAPSAHSDGEAARRGIVRGAGHAGQGRHDRRGLRRPHACRHRPQRRPFPLRSVRAQGLPAFIAIVLAVSFAGCGKKGPPLAPLRLVPAAVSELAARQTGDDVELRFALPATNANGPGQIDLARIEIYAITVGPGAAAPPNRDLLVNARLVGTIAVKPPPVEGETEKPGVAAGQTARSG